MQEILDVIHKTIYSFFDVCGDDEEMPLTDKDKLLLKVNKAICNNLKTLEPKIGHWIECDILKMLNVLIAECVLETELTTALVVGQEWKVRNYE